MTIPTFPSAAFRTHILSRTSSFSSSAGAYFTASNTNRHCASRAHTSLFTSARNPNCHIFCNRLVSCLSLMSSSRRTFVIKDTDKFRSQRNGFFRSTQSRPQYLCIPVRDFSSQSKVHEQYTAPIQPDSLLAEEIEKRIIFKNGSIIAINKPNGLSVFGSSKQNVNSSYPVPLVSALPKLKEALHCPDLDIGLSLKSFYSGIVVLCKHKKSKQQMERVLAGARAQKIQFMTYLAITVGVPQCTHGLDMTANIKRGRLHDREMSTVSDVYSQNAAVAGIMMQTCLNVQPLVVNDSIGVALVQVTINKDKWEAVEVVMSHYLSPVLGDHIYSSRTQMIRGIPFVASTHTATPGTQKVPLAIMEALQTKEDVAEKDLPLFVHRHKVVLNKFHTRTSKPVVIIAPPQEEFLTTLQCLGLYKEGMFS